MSNLCIHQQSWFDRVDLVLFCIGFLRYFGVLDGYARCCSCGVDLEFSGRGLAPFREHVRGKKQLLRDSAFRCAHQMRLLTVDGVAMTPRAVERRLRLLEGRSFPVVDSLPDESVAQAIEMERDGGSVWESFFGLASEVNSTSRLWLSLKTEQIHSGGCLKDVVAHWENVKQFPPSTEALDSLEDDQWLDHSG